MLKKLLTAFLVFLITTFVVGFVCGYMLEAAEAKPIIGQDTLAILHPKFDAHRQLPKNTALGVLDWTFGPDTNLLRSYLDQVAPRIVRVHLINTTCVRNQNCGPYEIGYGYTVETFDNAVRNREKEILAFVSRRTKVYAELSSKYRNTKFLISPALEHNLSRESWRVLADTVLREWPAVQLVNSPLDTSRAERYRGAWIEGHGPGASTEVDINSLDGVDATDIAVGSWLKRFDKIKVLYVWSRSYNCRNQGPFEDPRKRYSCPTRATAQLLGHITDPRGTPGKMRGDCQLLPFKSPHIWKPLSEDKGNGDPRANLPVTIISAAKAKIDVVDATGRILGYLGYYGPYQGTQNRYYSGQNGSGKSGYQFSSTWAWLKQGPKCWGPLITGRRQGEFREKRE